MAKTDYSRLTTDDLLQIIPDNENREWEFKAANIFERARFGEFKSQDLPKIVSSFANSGGGQLLLGKRNAMPHIFEGVPATEGRASMEDHLSLVISQSVTPHYKDFTIHRVPIAGQNGESVLVVEFEDSQAAPHQSNFGPNYYWRLPGHCKEAPHFHLELLRSRFTKSLLKINAVEHVVTSVSHAQQYSFHVALRVTVENVSMQSATAWGVQVKQGLGEYGWTEETVHRDIAEGACVHGLPQVLLPSEQANVIVRISKTIPSNWDTDDFRFVLRPVSQNAVGGAFLHPRDDRGVFIAVRSDLYRKIREYHPNY